jgi:biotin carboxyl carrier protein
MPGTILKSLIKEGQNVKKGDVLFILEAMKMENEIMVDHDAIVSKILVSKGASVNTGDCLALLK